MASRRNLKKEINSFCLKVVFECFTFLEYSPSLNQENTRDIMSDAINLRNKLVYMVNHPKGKEWPGSVKEYYNQIREELYRQNVSLLRRLNSLSR